MRIQSYDNWHFFGHEKTSRERPPSRSALSSPAPSLSPDANRPPLTRSHRSSGSDATAAATKAQAPSAQEPSKGRAVVCRVSTHTLRLEREFQLSTVVVKNSDPDCRHFVRPIELVRLPTKAGEEPLIASVFEAPGDNFLKDLVTFGPNWYRFTSAENNWRSSTVQPDAGVPLLTFLDFAVGATECLEILHHGHEIVHGELRGDAFHFASSGVVKMINFGSGARSFENGLTSAGWNTLSREVGIELKLAFIAPEQTGRMPAEPDSRTDIYSLGILFYAMLCGTTPFDGATALDVMQSVISKRIPPVTSKRMDIPVALSNVIQRMTQRNIEDRYHSTSGKWKQTPQTTTAAREDAMQTYEPLGKPGTEILTRCRSQIGSRSYPGVALRGRCRESQNLRRRHKRHQLFLQSALEADRPRQGATNHHQCH
jgi:hypothetical protein